MSRTPNLPLYPKTSFTRFYAMSSADVESLNKFLLDDSFTAAVGKLFSNPSDYVVNLRYYPFNVSLKGEYTAGPLVIGNDTATDIIVKEIVNPQLSFIDFGSLRIPRQFNNFLDYSPYTKIDLYLPFLGYMSLDVNSVMGKLVQILYAVDLYEGICTAFIITDDSDLHRYTLDSKQGRISTDIALGGNNVGDIAKNLIGVGSGAAVGVMSAILSKGATAPALVGTLASTGVGVVTGMRETITKHGVNGGASSLFYPNSAYLIITRPVVNIPSGYSGYYGKPCGETLTLNTLNGFTKVDSVHLENIETATDVELRDIETLLKEGVIL